MVIFFPYSHRAGRRFRNSSSTRVNSFVPEKLQPGRVVTPEGKWRQTPNGGLVSRNPPQKCPKIYGGNSQCFHWKMYRKKIFKSAVVGFSFESSREKNPWKPIGGSVGIRICGYLFPKMYSGTKNATNSSITSSPPKLRNASGKDSGGLSEGRHSKSNLLQLKESFGLIQKKTWKLSNGQTVPFTKFQHVEHPKPYGWSELKNRSESHFFAWEKCHFQVFFILLNLGRLVISLAKCLIKHHEWKKRIIISKYMYI